VIKIIDMPLIRIIDGRARCDGFSEYRWPLPCFVSRADHIPYVASSR
jgi:hypothetical protein